MPSVNEICTLVKDVGRRCLCCEVIHEPDHHLSYEVDDEPDMEVPDQIGQAVGQ